MLDVPPQGLRAWLGPWEYPDILSAPGRVEAWTGPVTAEARSYDVHILTKVFVLIASILSVVMAALAVSYGANANAIKSAHANAVSAKIAAESSFQMLNDTNARKEGQYRQNEDRLNLEKAELQKTITENEAQINALTIDLRQAKAARDSIEGKIAQLGVTTQTQVELISEYKDEVSRLRDGELTWRNEKLDLEASLSDAQSKLGVYEQVKRSLEEQIIAMQRAMDGESVAEGPAVATEISGPQIRGTVQEVRPEPATGETIIRISLGSNDRVRNNSKLFLVRDGSTFLGNVVIFETDLNTAFGRVTGMQPGMQVRVDDQVWSKLGR